VHRDCCVLAIAEAGNLRSAGCGAESDANRSHRIDSPRNPSPA
jgi:hypothetical protein